MRSLIFIILAGYAVRCDDTSYYVIEMPEETKEYAKPFRVYWNVPTMQCRSKKIPFDGILDQFGILQNKGDGFRGEKVTILYDPGLFPALLKNETSGKFKFRNGGVPQEGDLEKHLLAFRSSLEQSVPDENFSGIGIIDFESWRPVFRQNFGVLIPYKDVSYQIERKLHWFWTERAIQARARQRFEESARAFMQTTLSVAKQLRPRALWGYYGFPYCFNMASNHMVPSCADNVPQENDKIHWLWSESSALYPSVYSSKDLSPWQLSALIRGRVAEAARVKRRGTPILPYFWFRYRDGGFMSQTDLNVALETLYKSDASGFIIWGSSNDVNTVDKCNKLLKYTTEVLGPAIAKYTKQFSIRNGTTNSDTTQDPVSNTIGLTTWRPVLKDHLNPNNSKKPVFLDPEYHWDPPENYTQDIVHFVEQEFKKKPEYSVNNTKNQTVLANSKKNLLIEFILNLFRKDEEDEENKLSVQVEEIINNEDKTSQTIDSSTVTANFDDNVEKSSSSPPSIVTKNPLDALRDDTKSPELPSEQKLESDNSPSSTVKLNVYVSATTPSYYTTRIYGPSTDIDNDSKTHTVIIPQEKVITDKPTIIENTNSYDRNKETDLEYLDELITLTNIVTNLDNRYLTTANNNSLKENDKDLLLENRPNEGFTLDNLNNVTEISFSTDTTEVTSTSHELLSTVPLLNKLDDNLSTDTLEDLFFDIINDTTNIIESTSTTEKPGSTWDFILGIAEENKRNTNDNDNRTYKDTDTTEQSNYTSQTSETTDASTTIGMTPSTEKYEFDQESLYDDNFSKGSNENSTESNITVPVVDKQEIRTTRNEKSLEEISSSTNELSESTEATTSETDFIVRYSESAPDSTTEDFIEANTTEVTSTTDHEPKVTGASNSSADKTHYIFILLSFSLLYNNL